MRHLLLPPIARHNWRASSALRIADLAWAVASHVDTVYLAPMLELEKWAQRRAINSMFMRTTGAT